MTAIDNTPTNKNFLSPLNFKFQIKKTPHVNFFAQKVNFPSISLPDVEFPNPMIKIPYWGDHLDYGELRVSFMVDEDLTNYMEIHNWIRALGKPEAFDDYAKLQSIPTYTGDGLVSDISLTILNSGKMPNYEVIFRDAFPVSLGDLQFDSTLSDVDYLEMDATFKYTLYEINQL
jgi:hypothetical protein